MAEESPHWAPNVFPSLGGSRWIARVRRGLRVIAQLVSYTKSVDVLPHILENIPAVLDEVDGDAPFVGTWDVVVVVVVVVERVAVEYASTLIVDVATRCFQLQGCSPS